MSKNFRFNDLTPAEERQRKNPSTTYIAVDEIKEDENNSYELVDIDELADSINEMGLLQPLLVKKRGKFEYEIVAGHRRFNAIKKLIKDGKLESDYEVHCKKVDPDENDLITRMRLHETNLQTRSLSKMSEKEKLAVVSDYMDIIKKAKKENIKINGESIKGRTRELIAERFGISPRTAQDIITKVKEEESGEGISQENGEEKPDKKTPTTVDKLKKIVKQVEKMEFDGTEEENAAKEELIELLMN